MTSQNITNDLETRPAPSQPLVDWMDRHFDALRREHSGPEALAWDGHALQAVAGQSRGVSNPA
jgi:hypothetical protein